MHPQTHLVLSWLTGSRMREHRDRVLIAWSGMAPDADGLSLLAGVDAYGRWHHVVGHGLCAALATAVIVAMLARERARTVLLAMLAFHLHLICDLLGSGSEWGIAYLYPFHAWEITFAWGWPLASWQNVALTAVALAACAAVAICRGHSFVEALLGRRADAAVVETLRRRVSDRVERRPAAE